ncbi:hypothetical protein ACPXB3_22085 [Gordonia sp. DT219]|uniref:hypothetical protein n=1 Tax=Gordonia sp. DT219 TaxID=3416658 RepID=UPI003CE7C1DA
MSDVRMPAAVLAFHLDPLDETTTAVTAELVIFDSNTASCMLADAAEQVALELRASCGCADSVPDPDAAPGSAPASAGGWFARLIRKGQ